jgi:hypothetical protein
VHEQALIHGLMGIGVVAIIAKIHRWDESAMFFDGGSLGELDSPSRPNPWLFLFLGLHAFGAKAER